MLGTAIKISISKYAIYHAYKDGKIVFFSLNIFNHTKEKERKKEVTDENHIIKLL